MPAELDELEALLKPAAPAAGTPPTVAPSANPELDALTDAVHDQRNHLEEAVKDEKFDPVEFYRTNKTNEALDFASKVQQGKQTATPQSGVLGHVASFSKGIGEELGNTVEDIWKGAKSAVGQLPPGEAQPKSGLGSFVAGGVHGLTNIAALAADPIGLKERKAKIDAYDKLVQEDEIKRQEHLQETGSNKGWVSTIPPEAVVTPEERAKYDELAGARRENTAAYQLGPLQGAQLAIKGYRGLTEWDRHNWTADKWADRIRDDASLRDAAEELKKGKVDEGGLVGPLTGATHLEPAELERMKQEGTINPESIAGTASVADPSNLVLAEGLRLPIVGKAAGYGLRVSGGAARAIGSVADKLISHGAGKGLATAGAGVALYKVGESAIHGDMKPLGIAVALFAARSALRRGGGLVNDAGREIMDEGFVSPSARAAADTAAGEAAAGTGPRSASGAALENFIDPGQNMAAASRVARRTVQGAAMGAVGGVPFAALADNPEDAGKAIGGGVAFGGALGPAGAVEGSLNRAMEINKAATVALAERGGAQRFNDAGLQKQNDAAMQDLPTGAQTYLNAMRGLVSGFKSRTGDTMKMAVLNQEDYARHVSRLSGADPDAVGTSHGFYDARTGTIYLNKGNLRLDSAGHETGHFITSEVMRQMGRAYGDALRNATESGLFNGDKPTPEFQKFIDDYNSKTPGTPIPSDRGKGSILTHPAVSEYLSETVRGILGEPNIGRYMLPKDVSDHVADKLVKMYGNETGGKEDIFSRTDLPTIHHALKDVIFDLGRGLRPDPARGRAEATAEPTAPESGSPATGTPETDTSPQTQESAPNTGMAENHEDIGLTQDAIDAVRDYHINFPGMEPVAQRANARKGIGSKSKDKVAEERGAEWDEMFDKYAEYLRTNGLQAPADPTELHQQVIWFHLASDPVPKVDLSTTPKAAPALAPAAAEATTSRNQPGAQPGALEPSAPARQEQGGVVTEQEISNRLADAEQQAGSNPAKRKEARINALLDVVGEGASEQGSLQRRKDAGGRERFTGTLDPDNNTAHRMLLDEMGVNRNGQAAIALLNNHVGKTVYLDYKSAPKTEPGDLSGKQRSEEYKASTPEERKAGGEHVEQQGKAFHILGFRVWPKSGGVAMFGFSPDKWISNAHKLIEHLKGEGMEPGYSDINDPSLPTDVQAYSDNHANGWKGDGSAPVEGREPTPGYTPTQIPENRFQLLNAALNFDISNKADSKRAGARENAMEAQYRALENEVPLDEETGDVNPLRALINKSGKLVSTNAEGKTRTGTGEHLESVYENISPDLVTGVSETNDGQNIVRPAGFEGNPGALAEKGIPRYDYASSGFMPDAGAESVKKEFRKYADGIDGLSIDVTGKGDRVTLDQIDVEEQKRGTGIGRDALKKLTDLADQHGVTLDLEVSDRADIGTASWYKRNGFEWKNGYMERKPVERGALEPESAIPDKVDGYIKIPGTSVGGTVTGEKGKGASIYEWDSRNPKSGETNTALKALKSKFGELTVIDAGADGTSSNKYWRHQLKKGLIDRMIDENSGVDESKSESGGALEPEKDITSFKTKWKNEAEKAGSLYQGQSDQGLHTFKEESTGGNFSIKDGEVTPEKIQEKADEVRKSFGGEQVNEGNLDEWLKSNGFMPGKGRALEDKPEVDKLGFYSGLSRIIDKKIPNRASGDQILATLKGAGAKQEEIDTMRLQEFLKSHDGPVTKAELKDFVKAGGVQLREITNGDEAADARADRAYQLVELRDTLENRKRRGYDDLAEPEDRAKMKELEEEFSGMTDNQLKNTKHEGNPKFEKWKLPGGSNYKEILLTLPSKGGKPTGPRGWESANNPNSASGDADFRSSHWDEPNVLAHIRQQDMKDAEGSKVRLIEELQSDIHQKGRKEGYATNKLESYQRSLMEKYGTKTVPQTFLKATEAEQNKWDELRQSYRPDGVPDFPFKKTWAELAFKRALRLAIDDGMDVIAWTPGEIQNERYDLSKALKHVEYHPNTDEFYAYDHKNDLVHEGEYSPGQLADVIGKDAAEKLLAQDKDEEGRQILEGDGLKVGGKGMIGFYDKIMPAFVNKYLKQWGSSARLVDHSASGEGFANVIVVPADKLADFPSGLPFAEKTDSGINIKLNFPLPESGMPEGAYTYAKLAGDLSKWKSGGDKSFSNLPIELQIPVVDRVRSMLHDPKIAKTVIGLIPVDVMNNLAGGERATKMLLHEPSMLSDHLAVDDNAKISAPASEALDAVVRSSAFPITEVLFGTKDSGLLPEDLRGTKGASDFHGLPVSNLIDAITSRNDSGKEGTLNTKVWQAPITPAMKEAISQGQPLFMPGSGEKGGKEGALEGEKDSLRFKRSENPPEEKNLVALHNVSLDKLEKAMDLGGLAVPSLAIMKKEHAPMEGFGEISLIANKNLINPETTSGNRVFESDIYSMRHPDPTHEVDKKALKALRGYFEKSRPDWYKIDPSVNPYDVISWADRKGEGNLERFRAEAKRSNMFKIAFVEEQQGKQIEQKMRRVPLNNGMITETKAFQDIMNGPGEFDWNDYNQYGPGSKIAKAIKAAADEVEQTHAKEGLGKRLKESILDRYLDEEGGAYFGRTESLRQDLGHIKNKTEELDRGAIRDQVETYIADHRQEFQDWLDKKIEPVFHSPSVKTTRGKQPYTLDNIVDAMTKRNVRGQEGSLAVGLGLSRARSAKEYKTVDQMRKDQAKLTSSEDFEKARDRTQDLFFKGQSAVAEAYEGNQFDALDDASRAMGDFLKAKGKTAEQMRYYLRKNGYTKGDLHPEDLEKMVKAANSLKQMPTEYFEAKLHRAVKISEFSGAVIPDYEGKQYKAIIEKLKSQGLDVETYDKSKEGDRQRAVHAVIERQGAAFMPKVEGSGALSGPASTPAASRTARGALQSDEEDD